MTNHPYKKKWGQNFIEDSNVINKRIVDIRHKNMISGSVAKGFKITIKGRKIAEKVAK